MTISQTAKAIWSNFMIEKNQFGRVLDKVRLITANDGRCTAELTVAEEHSNSHGTLHGGLSATIVDIVSTLALVTHKRQAVGVSVDLHVSTTQEVFRQCNHGNRNTDDLRVSSVKWQLQIDSSATIFGGAGKQQFVTYHCGSIQTYELYNQLNMVELYFTPIKAWSPRYLKGAEIGEDVVIEANTIRAGKTLAFLEVYIKKKSDGSLVAKGSHTKFVGNETGNLSQQSSS